MDKINIWWALGFMFAGFAIAHIFNAMAWRKYYEGRDEARGTADGKYARSEDRAGGGIACGGRAPFVRKQGK